MEQSKKSRLLLAAAITGSVYWISLVVLIVIGLIKSKTGFFEGLSNLVKSLAQGGEGSGWVVYCILAFVALLAASVLSIFACIKGSKLPAYIAAVLYLPSLNFLSPILCITGAKPRFLEGKKTTLFVAGYIGAVCLLLWTGMSFIPEMDAVSKTVLIVFSLITLAAVVLNFFGWRTSSALITLISGIVYSFSALGIPSAVLNFIVYAKLEKPFLRGKNTLLFIAVCIGAVCLLLWTGMSFIPEMDAVSKTIFIVFSLITLAAVVLNFLGWRKNDAKLTLAAAIVYILTVLPSAVLCFIGRAKLKKQEAGKGLTGEI